MGNFHFIVLTSSDVLVYDKITFTFKCCNRHGLIVHHKRYYAKCAMTLTLIVLKCCR